ncbi:MbtH family NRPS accessory protein [Peribacillus frigoritolerans]|jgi:MbtH protein|uniref:MbtH family NRPS accessory protein n=1 Tax=Peribacillus frigoritolerans TaxID=450367 RepID=UPI002ED55AA4|nr:MbtH family NRPS accessory protein [Peribacillus frigoritolerans]
MTNRFVNENGIYNEFIIEEGRNSLWPAFLVIPEGWSLIYRKDCWKYIKLVASIDGTK